MANTRVDEGGRVVRLPTAARRRVKQPDQWRHALGAVDLGCVARFPQPLRQEQACPGDVGWSANDLLLMCLLAALRSGPDGALSRTQMYVEQMASTMPDDPAMRRAQDWITVIASQGLA